MQSYSAESERELFPLSWLTQYGYCPRRCGLMALEQLWTESADTAAGRAQHPLRPPLRTERQGYRTKDRGARQGAYPGRYRAHPLTAFVTEMMDMNSMSAEAPTTPSTMPKTPPSSEIRPETRLSAKAAARAAAAL